MKSPEWWDGPGTAPSDLIYYLLAQPRETFDRRQARLARCASARSLLAADKSTAAAMRESLLAFIAHMEWRADENGDNWYFDVASLSDEVRQTWQHCLEITAAWRHAGSSSFGRLCSAVRMCASTESRVWNALDNHLMSASVLRDVARFPYAAAGLCNSFDCMRYPKQVCRLCQLVRTPLVLRSAAAVYENATGPLGRLDWRDCAVLADMLEDAGCANADLLAHLRRPDDGNLYHVKGCWAVDAAVGKYRYPRSQVEP